MDGLDVIMMCSFHQAPFGWHSWFFKSKDGLNNLGTKFCHENIKCYELQQIMWQNYIYSLLRFWIDFKQHKHFKI
jgi:hypothetical protein